MIVKEKSNPSLIKQIKSVKRKNKTFRQVYWVKKKQNKLAFVNNISDELKKKTLHEVNSYLNKDNTDNIGNAVTLMRSLLFNKDKNEIKQFIIKKNNVYGGLSFNDNKDNIEIQTLVVHPEILSKEIKGIGSKLLFEIFKRANKDNKEIIISIATKIARPFYEYFGFKKSSLGSMKINHDEIIKQMNKYKEK